MMRRKGFTLTELIVVIVIIGILAAIAVPAMTTNVNKAKRSEAIAALGSIRTAQKLYKTETSTYSTTLAGLSGYIARSDFNGRYYGSGNYNTSDTSAVADDTGAGGANMDINSGTITQP